MASGVKARKSRCVTADAALLYSLVLALFLLVGVLLGYAVSGRCAVGSNELRSYFDDCVSRSAELPLSAETVIRTLVCFFRASVAAFLLGFSSVGVACLPLLFTAQGFLLSFSLFSFAEAAGRDGFLSLNALFAIRLLFVPSCTFVLGVAAMERSWALASLLGGKRTRPVTSGLYRFAVCCVCLLLGCALELWLVPILLRVAA